jgi:peptidyl-prolyl cis-trans isomerase SurA
MANGMLRRVGTALIAGALLVAASLSPALAQSVRVTVNGTPITDLQVSQRVKLFELEGNRGGTRGATEQLIDEAIQMSEAKRLGITVSNAQVDDALLQVARNLRVSQERLVQIMGQAGVNMETLKDRLRAAVAWNGVTQAAIMTQVQLDGLALDQQAASRIKDHERFDYILKEIIFVGAGSGARSGQANNYRSKFNGCDNAVSLSLNYTDAAVIDIGRRHATQLPEALAKELAGLNVGGITKPRVVEQGVSMLAICEKAQANDLTFVKGQLEAEAGNSALEARVKECMANLRAQAKIIYN